MHKKIKGWKKNHPARLRARLDAAIAKSMSHPHHNGWWHVSCSHQEYDRGSQVIEMIEQITGIRLSDSRMSQTIGQMLVSLALNGDLKKLEDGSFVSVEVGFNLFVVRGGVVMEYRGSLYTIPEVARVVSTTNVLCCDYSSEEWTPSPWEVGVGKIHWSAWTKPGPRPPRTPRA